MLRSKSVMGTLIVLFVLIAFSLGIYQIYKIKGVHTLTIAAGEKGGDTYQFAETLAQIVNEAEVKIKLDLVETLEATDTAHMVQSGEADLGILQLDRESWSEIRLVVLIYPEVFHLIVRRDSGIQSPADLIGKVVATNEEIFPDILEYYSLRPDMVKVLPLSGDDALKAFVNREVDAVFRWSEPGTPRVVKLVQEGQGRLVPFDQFESMRLINAPYIVEYTLPRGLYQAGNPVVPAADLKTVGSYKALVANSKVDPAFIRTITRILFEHQNTLVTEFPLAIYLRSPTTTQMVGPSVHPGALAYYDKDKPTFFQQYAAEISVALAIAPILASVVVTIWAWIQNKQQTRAKLHIQAVQNALVRLSEARDLQSAEVVEQRLLKILAQFTKDLNEGNINSEDAQTFSLVWDKAMTTSRNRMMFATSSHPLVPPSRI